MALELIPNVELVFKGPFNAVSTTALKLANTGNEKLAYKIKTTAPKRYCVKPNSGFLDGHASTNVQVMLQPQTNGQPDDRTRHKFMVQWVVVPESFNDDVENFWKQDLKSLNVQDAKLKCVFDESTTTTTLSSSNTVDDSQKSRVVDQPRSPAIDSTDNRSSPVTSRTSTQYKTVEKDTGDDSTRIRLKQEIDRLKAENDSLADRLKQSESGLHKRSTTTTPSTGNTYANLSKSNPSQQNGLVLFGFRLTEQIVLVAFVLALLFGFSLGYFLFSCSN